jgi:hypothetical protein
MLHSELGLKSVSKQKKEREVLKGLFSFPEEV